MMTTNRRRIIAASLVAGSAVLTGTQCSAVPRPERTPKEWGRDEFFGAPDAFDTTVTIDWRKARHAANPLLCGTNVQWVDGGDGLLAPGTVNFVPEILERVKRLSPSVVRYPGGSHSDVFDWRTGQGSLAQRGSSEHFHRRERQVVRLGTTEFLAMCEALGAQAMITVNTATLPAQVAADWVTLTNVTRLRSPVTGKALPSVQYWEIGNEPYLQEKQRPETWIKPAEFARRANEFIAAMRKVDPTIRIGLPLRSDKYSSGLPATPHPGYNEAVLAGVSAPADYVAVHNAYMPFAIDRVPTDSELHASMMASVETVRDDLDLTRTQLSRFPARRNLPIALTEYNAFVSIGTATDTFLAAPAGVVYVADLLRLLAERSDIMMANHWSLIGNWYFGALGFTGRERPAFEVLRMFRDTLRGQVVAIDVKPQRQFSAPRLGAARAASGLAAVTGLATRDGQQARVLLINKSPNAETRVTLPGLQAAPGSWSLRSWSARSAFANPDRPGAYVMADSQVQTGASPVSLTLAPCSVCLLSGTLAQKA